MEKRNKRGFILYHPQIEQYVSAEELVDLTGYQHAQIYRQIPKDISKNETRDVGFKIKGEKTLMFVRVTRLS